jgi:hypothetical protein
VVTVSPAATEKAVDKSAFPLCVSASPPWFWDGPVVKITLAGTPVIDSVGYDPIFPVIVLGPVAANVIPAPDRIEKLEAAP